MQKRAFFLAAALICGTSNLPAVTYAEVDAGLADLKAMYEQNPTQEQSVYNYALALARSGEYSVSLNLFKDLAANTANLTIIYDYAVVLTWAGDYSEAIRVYENQIAAKDQAPSYVTNNIAGAYYRLGNFSQAQKLFHKAALQGNIEAKRWEAESLMRMNHLVEANQIYAELIEKAPGDADNYLSRAAMLMLSGDTVSAAVDVQKALALLPGTPEGNERRRQIRSNMAVSFIQNGDYPQAIVLLQPIVANGSADMKTTANYILAIRLNGDYKLAMREAETIWPDYAKVPDFGLQALADSYLRLDKLNKAIAAYDLILRRNNTGTNLNAVKLSKGYAYLRKGDLKTGLALYQETVTAYPDLAYIMADDAAYFWQSGKFYIGKALYTNLIHMFPDNALYRKQYAAQLISKELPRAAYQEYAALSTLKDGLLVGLAGSVDTSLDLGDYKTAATANRRLMEGYGASPIAGQASKKYETRIRGTVEPSFEVLQDYKGNDVRTSMLAASYHLAGRVSVLAEDSEKKVSDDELSTTIHTYSVGAQYQDIRHDATIWLDNYHIGSSFNSYRFAANHYFDDLSSVGLTVQRTPVEDAEALRTPIMATDYQFQYERKFNLRDSYTLKYISSVYSDGNHASSYDTTFAHTMHSTTAKQINWFASLSRLHYKFQSINGNDTPYESPTVREAYSLGLKEHWAGPKNYWNAVLSVAWDRDRPEGFGFSPSAEIEYGYDFSKYSSLVIGGAYGIHTDAASRNLGFGYRRYYINYRVTM